MNFPALLHIFLQIFKITRQEHEMNKKDVAHILEEIGIILDLKGENPFKVRAYYNGARIVETLDKDLGELVNSGEIAEIKGIGKALAEKISTLVNDGSLPFYEELKSSISEGLLEMLKIPGLGSKKVKVIHDKLGISSIGELEYACRENRLRDLEGFGQKSQDKVLKSIELQKKYSERFLIPVAESESEKIIAYLKKNSKIIRIDIAGSLRRKMETIKDLYIIASCDEENREDLMSYFVSYDQSIQIISQGATKSAIILDSGMRAELRLVNDMEYPFLLQHATGCKEHNTKLRRLAKEQNYKMNEYGLFSGDKLIPCRNENEIYTKLGLQIIPPERREGLGEIESAKAKNLQPAYDGKPFHGLFHVHTTYSDGANSLKEIAESCQSMGFEYVGICDHSKSAFYANGLAEERVMEQQKEINQLNTTYSGFKIFKGIEADILQDGSLDYEDNVLATFDFVIASVHSNFNLSEEAMTERICRALKNPYVTMLGHPTGRLLLAREPYELNMEKVIEVAGKEKKIIEINANPFRLDLDWRWGHLARNKGIKTAINPDAHSIDGLKDYQYGISIAQKGGFRKEDILNTYTSSEVEAYFKI
jgi:DNA polymerase (family 10)